MPNFTSCSSLTSNSRKGLGEQAEEKAKPDSQKSYTEVASENITGGVDKVAAAVQPGTLSQPHF